MNIKKISLLSLIFVTGFALNSITTAMDQTKQNIKIQMMQGFNKVDNLQKEPLCRELDQKLTELDQIFEKLEQKEKDHHVCLEILKILNQKLDTCETNEARNDTNLAISVVREGSKRLFNELNELQEKSTKLQELIENNKDPMTIKYLSHITQLTSFGENFKQCDSPICFENLEKDLQKWHKNN